MAVMSKLLNKPFKVFTIYALIILLCSVPVYYLVVDFIWLHELDEHNSIIKESIENRFDEIEAEGEEFEQVLAVWNILQPDARLEKINDPGAYGERIYTITKPDPGLGDIDRFRGLSTPVTIHGESYLLTVETNVEESDETLLAIAAVTFLFFSFLVVGFIVLNRRIAKNIWRPFRSSLAKLKNFDLAKNREVQFESSEIEEFEELNRELERLISRNVEVFNQQKTFIENASHELQTPLAVLKSKIDLLLQNKDLSVEQSEIVSSIGVPLSRVSRINKNLLTLMKIENDQFEDTEDVEVVNLLNETLDLLSGYLESGRLLLEKKELEEHLMNCNKFLLETLLNNLLTNAIRHTDEGTIMIELKHNVLYICNSGKAGLDKEKLFKRFSGASSGSYSSGLGLAIVKEICNRYGWQVSYSFSENYHCFSVKF